MASSLRSNRGINWLLCFWTLFTPMTHALNFSVECRGRVYSILNGSGDPYGNLTEQDLYRNNWIYRGPVRNLADEVRYNTSIYIAVTLEGMSVKSQDIERATY